MRFSFVAQWAEAAGYFESTSLAAVMKAADGPVTFFDSVSGKPLFTAPKGRSVAQFLDESYTHG